MMGAARGTHYFCAYVQCIRRLKANLTVTRLDFGTLNRGKSGGWPLSFQYNVILTSDFHFAKLKIIAKSPQSCTIRPEQVRKNETKQELRWENG